jgi:non-homologous end joining protein Ku
VLWNGLKHNRLAYVTKATFTAGSADRILVLYATETALMAAALPFAPQLYDEHPFAWQDNPAVGQMFKTEVVEKEYTEKPFVLADQCSEYSAHRAAVIEAVLAGQPVLSAAPAPAKAETPDLMAILTASVNAQNEKKAQEPEKVAA